MFWETYFCLPAILLVFSFYFGEAAADPGKYPQFAQQQLPGNVAPDFISVDELADAIVKGEKPVIVDVRSAEEYEESHIKAALSIPLGEIPLHLAEMPKERLLVLY